MFQICLELYKGYHLLFYLFQRGVLRTKEKTFLDLSFLPLLLYSLQCHLFDDTQVSFYHIILQYTFCFTCKFLF